MVFLGLIGLMASKPAAATQGEIAVKPCQLRPFDLAAHRTDKSVFRRAECGGGVAIATVARRSAAADAIFTKRDRRWVEVADDVGATNSVSGAGAEPLEYAQLNGSISSGLLLNLARPLGTSVEQAVGAGLLNRQESAFEDALHAQDEYLISPVVSDHGHSWLVLIGNDTALGSPLSAPFNVRTGAVAHIYEWEASTWTTVGAVNGSFGPVGGCCSISPEHLTASSAPDFASVSGGAADTNWLSVLSDVGGSWHLVPFEYGYAETSLVNGAPRGNEIVTMIDASSAAGGPTTYQVERYEDGAFVPTSPPGTQAPCSFLDLQVAADTGQLRVLTLSKFACADGWALASGTGAGFSGQVVGLFQEDNGKWQLVQLDNGDSLGVDPWIYDIPLSVLDQLASSLGAGLASALATAPLIAQPNAMTGSGPCVTGVMEYDGVDWYVNEKALVTSANPAYPTANASIYRWNGAAWIHQGEVDDVPVALNCFNTMQQWFEPVATPGSPVPSFVLGSLSASAEVLTDAGGEWHAANVSS